MRGGTSCEGTGENFGGDGNVLYLDRGNGYKTMHLSKFIELYKKVNCAPCKFTSINLTFPPKKMPLTRFQCTASTQNPRSLSAPRRHMLFLDDFATRFSDLISHQNQQRKLSKPSTPGCDHRLFWFPRATDHWKAWPVTVTHAENCYLKDSGLPRGLPLSVLRENFQNYVPTRISKIWYLYFSSEFQQLLRIKFLVYCKSWHLN